ncbi:DUF5610 domain-containing protein [Janthinobacterium sp. PC23-8]|uniref:DUF5610 domain-containing protein n=1 Tax=Janthinobacterium sp. PC23-8 TaxID=2012679 RepID=UPI0020CD7517|nr:DUF5610 domain-containing protein [Janthinobacterium sp. PC23-8]
MSIPIAASGNSGSSLSSVSNAASSTTGTVAGKEDKVRQAEGGNAQMSVNDRSKLQLNAAILQASMNVSISSQNDPLALVYKSAITSINEALKADFGDDAVQNAAAQDNSAEATAQRIVSLSTGFFDAFKKQNPGMDNDAALEKFMGTITGGMEKGFSEARDILKGLNVLQGDIAGNIDKTHELVQKGYADFVAAHSSKKADTAA